MSETLTIRPVTIEDAAGFDACLDSVAREGLYLAKTRSPGVDRIRAMIENGLENRAPRMVAVTADGDIVGWCDAGRSATESLRHRAELGMGVLSSHRGRGIGRALVEAFLAEARKLGITRVDLDVREDNTAAIALYLRCGFRELGRRERGIFQQGRYHRLIAMEWLPD